MLEVREISAFETCALRQKILRPLQTPADCVWPGDDEPGNFHLGVFTAERRLVGVGTFMREGLAKFPDAVKPYRLRGMATDFDQHRRGVGRLLLTTAEERLRREGSKLLWFNAREVAFAFYEALGYVYASDLFDIPTVGPHRVMYKALSPR